MPPIPPLFTIPIPATGGSLVATQPAPQVYLLTFTSPPDNRLTPDFTAALLLALDIVELRLPRGVLVTTSGIAKFYSNGLDFEAAVATPGFFDNSFFPVMRRLLSYPMPTIALLNGHTFAGGLMYAMAHDYRVMNPSKGFCCMNEIDFGAPLNARMSGIFKAKLAPPAWRTVILEGRRLGAEAARAEGIVDELGGFDAVEKLIASRSLVTKGKSGIYSALKQELYSQELDVLDKNDEWEGKDSGDRRDRTDAGLEGSTQRVAAWEQSGGKIASVSQAKM